MKIRKKEKLLACCLAIFSLLILCQVAVAEKKALTFGDLRQDKTVGSIQSSLPTASKWLSWLPLVILRKTRVIVISGLCRLQVGQQPA